MSTLPISLVVMTYNEAANIARCLDSVPFAAEMLVVDCGSTDATCDIARAHGARVEHQDWLGFGPQRNACTALATHDWILVLDADEYLTPQLARELEAGLPQLMQSAASGAVLRRSTLFMGAPMRWYKPMCGERMARIYHRDRARWTEARVHESLRFEGKSITFQAPFNHLHNPTLVHKNLKVIRYAELKCRDWRDRGRAPRMWDWPLVYLAAFIKDYLLRRACLDGWRGFIVAQTAASYALYKRMRYYEMCRNPDSVAQAEQILARHDLNR